MRSPAIDRCFRTAMGEGELGEWESCGVETVLPVQALAMVGGPG